jgi:hypothetical protein
METAAMDEMDSKRDDIVGTTDYLEAITVFKAAKNFMFVIAVLSLVLVLTCFFLANSKYAQYGNGATSSSDALGANIEGLAAIAAARVEAAASGRPAAAETDLPRSAAMTPPIDSGTGAAVAGPPAPAPSAGTVKAPGRPINIKFEWISWTLKVSDFAAIVCLSLYSLILVFCLKVSLVGRLGGINHIARAFVWSLTALVFLLPWQQYFGGVMVGALFTAPDLKAACTRVEPRDVLEKILFYTRFAGLSALVILMMLAAQIRSLRWAKATLRRLGVM